MKTASIFILLMILPVLFVFTEDSEKEGEEKILDAIEQIQSEAEEEETEERETEDEGKKDREKQEEDNGFCEAFWELFFKILFEYSFTMRFADYPYAENSTYYYNTSTLLDPDERKIVSLQLATDFSYHFDGTFGNTNRVNLQLAAVHGNLFNQYIFAGSTRISVFSVNGGFSFFLQNFLLNGYLGAYKLSALDRYLLSFGFSSQFFFPAGFFIDIYNLNSGVNTVQFVHLSVNPNYTIWRFTFGVGYNYNRFVSTVFSGPCLKVSFWL